MSNIGIETLWRKVVYISLNQKCSFSFPRIMPLEGRTFFYFTILRKKNKIKKVCFSTSFLEFWLTKKASSVPFKFHNSAVSLADQPLSVPTGTAIS